jgi:23S rRNA (uracil1939-C5)-methyltransferase
MTLPPGCVAACPGCQHRTWSQAESEAQKWNYLAQTLAPWVHCLHPVQGVSGGARWHYRDKLCLHAAYDTQWQFGLMRRDQLIPIPQCPVHSTRAQHVITLFQNALPPPEIFPLAFYVQASAQATLVVKRAQPPPSHWLTPQVIAALQQAGLEGLWLNAFPSAGKNLFYPSGWTLLWGKPTSTDAHGITYGPAAFQQLIETLYHNSIDTAEHFLSPHPQAAVVDFYCGLGSTLARWQRAGAAAIGVELSGEAVNLAKHNAPATTVLRGTCAQRLPQLSAWLENYTHHEVLAYLNPPRSGLEPAVSGWLAAKKPARLAYLSCSAGTLRRDLIALEQNGYTIAALHPYDFFPQTHHVETLALLSRPHSGGL